MMGEWWALGPETRRVEGDRQTMLYDASRARNLKAVWFDPEFWRRRGAVEGEARGRGSTVFVAAGPLRMALRRYRRGGLVARLSRDRYLYLGAERTRPIREWCLTYSLHRLGLPVPAPVAARFRREGAWYTGEMLTERIRDARTLAEIVAAGDVPLSAWIAVGRCIRRFHDARVCHADLNAHNVLIDAADKVWLIDFDRGSLRSPGLWQDANLVRLRRSLLKVTDPLPAGRFSETDWQSLLAGYAQGPPPPAAPQAAASQPASAGQGGGD
jgi:3-deoxy-D-manno-octulosonic acid kinase